jgi:peptidase C25-like protein
MKKITSILIIFSIILGGLGAAAFSTNDTESFELMKKSIYLQNCDILINEKDQEYLEISLLNNDQFLLNPGKPVIPKMIQTFELPFGVTDINVHVSVSDISTQYIQKQIQPSPAPLPLSPIENYIAPDQKDERIYQSTELYPSESYQFNIGVGVNENFEHVTYVTVHMYPIQYVPATNMITIAEKMDITLTYSNPKSNPFPLTSDYDLAIIAPSAFSNALQPLIDHKNSYGIETTLKTVEDIYAEYNGFDKAEQVKFFIKDALEQWNIKYVLLVGGLKSTIYAKPKDNVNLGAEGWHIPVRYSNVRDGGDPGFPTDLYYEDIYKEGGAFETWDSDGDGVLAEFPDDIIDLIPDVAVGRLASSDATEVSEVVNKIINYETSSYGSEWFKKMIVYSGDGFLDQMDLNFQWDTKELSDGPYFIKAQSKNPEGELGPIDTIEITLDKTSTSQVTFNHDDHLNPIFEDGYPAPPIAEIVSVSNGDVLGNTDITYMPSEGEAYCNSLFWWANISYINEVLTIRGKSYDPTPYGNITDIHVWVENNQGEIVFSDWRYNLPQYYEGEWVTGEESEHGRGGALYYMPDEFEKEIYWCSNGKLNEPNDVIESFSQGWGFTFFSGHGSPGYWGDQYPGIPGNRQFGSVHGLVVSNLQSYPPFITETPIWPMKELANDGQFPITVVGGCHNSLFNVSLIPSAIHYYTALLGRNNWMWTYLTAVPQCWSWYIVQLPNTGSIACMGNTGLGWGWEGEFCTVGAGDGWISSEFFRQYGEHYGEDGYETLGQVYQQTQTSYVTTFKDYTLPECWWFPDLGWDAIDAQAVEQWVLFGDPSLKIGGYQ